MGFDQEWGVIKGFVSTYKKCLKVYNFIFLMLLLHTFEHLYKWFRKQPSFKDPLKNTCFVLHRDKLIIPKSLFHFDVLNDI